MKTEDFVFRGSLEQWVALRKSQKNFLSRENPEYPKIVSTVGAVDASDVIRGPRIAIARDGSILAIELAAEGVCVCSKGLPKAA